jgi:MarR family transcriptional regulator, organic hydroperoxide resistance regulator
MTASTARVFHKLQIAAHRAQKAADRALLATAGVNTAQAAVLGVVAAEASARGSVTQRDVARQLGINDSAMTSMATRLIGMELLHRDVAPEDVRAWNLGLTSGGRAARIRATQEFKRVNQTIDAILTEAEIERLADYLSRIATAFEKPEWGCHSSQEKGG